MSGDALVARDGASLGVAIPGLDVLEKFERARWTCEKWSEEACDFARRKLSLDKRDPVSSSLLIDVVGAPEELVVVEGNLLLNEGLQRLRDLLVVAGGVGYNNANAFIGVGDTATAEVATQTELLATQNAANRFYKAMNATFPTTAGQGATWASDFTTTEANFIWNEWTIAAGATTASGAGFLVGTTNLNRKVASLGTKTTGTWTLSATVTFA
jgi:hypothetical protein